MILALAVAAAAGAAGCSSERCEGDLAEVGAGCPATFDGTAANFPAAASTFKTVPAKSVPVCARTTVAVEQKTARHTLRASNSVLRDILWTMCTSLMRGQSAIDRK